MIFLLLAPALLSAFAASDDPALRDKQLIDSAMTAAPPNVAKGATIVVMEADGKTRTLSNGTNGYTCMPDNPATPGPDPMCMDKNALEWAMAWIGQKIPPANKVGFMYMLAGEQMPAIPTRMQPSPNPVTIGSIPDRT